MAATHSVVCQGLGSSACRRLRVYFRVSNNYYVRRSYHVSASLCSEAERHEDDDRSEVFRVLAIPGFNVKKSMVKRVQKSHFSLPPRYKKMPVGQDWTNVWPTAKTFNWSVVPLPLRQGISIGKENDGIPWGKYANMELMKIPNFLHLTPPHIKKHTQALKKFCTKWPAGLETDDLCKQHFPLEVTSSDFIADSATLRDSRARKVTFKYKMSAMDLDYHARDKMIRLLGERYDASTDEITLELDRCPLKRQNYDYGIYLMTVLFKESWKTEKWESEKTEDDMEKYAWDMNPSKAKTIKTLAKVKEVVMESQTEAVPLTAQELPEHPSEEDIAQADTVKAYVKALEELHDVGEDFHSLSSYKESVKSMLLPKTSSL